MHDPFEEKQNVHIKAIFDKISPVNELHTYTLQESFVFNIIPAVVFVAT